MRKYPGIHFQLVISCSSENENQCQEQKKKKKKKEPLLYIVIRWEGDSLVIFLLQNLNTDFFITRQYYGEAIACWVGQRWHSEQGLLPGASILVLEVVSHPSLSGPLVLYIRKSDLSSFNVTYLTYPKWVKMDSRCFNAHLPAKFGVLSRAPVCGM